MLSETMARELVIPFALDEKIGLAKERLIYRPWGTRTIKVKVSTHTDQPKLWLRPLNMLPEDAALGIYKAYADDNRAFTITWGGGHEIGPCVKTKDVLSAFETAAPLQAGDSSYLFFNLTHTGTDLPLGANISLRAFECLDQYGKMLEKEQARLVLPVQLPANIPPEGQIMHIIPGEKNNTWVVSPGRYLPEYDSRWWPTNEVAYSVSEPPPLLIHIDNSQLLIDWVDEGNLIASIEDYTKPSVLLLAETVGFEIFAFDQWSIALRVWFFWTDKYVGGDFFVGRHEVPDAERFDLIIRRKDGRVLLAGTDLHWREVWARVLPNKILQATLGMPRETAIKLAKEKFSETWNEIWAKAVHPSSNDPGREVINNPVEPYIRRLAEREATVTVKASGTEAHLPTLHNVEQRRPPVMTSSDVRMG